MSNEFNYDNDIPVAPVTFVSSKCEFSYGEDICGRRSVACTRCGEDTQLCREHTEGLCAECMHNDTHAAPIEESGLQKECKHCNRVAVWRFTNPDGNEAADICDECLDTVWKYREYSMRCFDLLKTPDPREQPMSDAGKFLFELGMDLNRVYRAGMKAGMK